MLTITTLWADSADNTLKYFSIVNSHEVSSLFSYILMLRARRNEKEVNVKPAASFKLLTIFSHQNNKTRFKTKECK